MEQLASGTVLWSFDQEIADRDTFESTGSYFSAALPFHRHEGNIFLCTSAIYIEGDQILRIPHTAIDQIYLGFDDLFTSSMCKNSGMLGQPLRIDFENEKSIASVYLIIDYHPFGTNHNHGWFTAIKDLLSI
jgi:hypothetical protein